MTTYTNSIVNGVSVPLTADEIAAFEASDAAAATPAATAPILLGQALGAGLAITSTATPALNATYALDQASQDQLYQIASYAQNFGVFPNGQSTMAYNDISGVPHTFTIRRSSISSRPSRLM